MKKSIFSLFLFGAVLSASPLSVTFESSIDSNGPYTLKVNGTNVQAMCVDDFLTVRGTWTANETAVNGNSFSNTYLGLSNQTLTINGKTLSTANVYSMEAYLFNQITQKGADRADIQEAAWAIMDPGTLAYVEKSDKAANNFLTQALNNYSSFNTSGYEIISQVNPGWNAEQEFITASPEPASLALFGAGLAAVGAARFFRRKKQITTVA